MACPKDEIPDLFPSAPAEGSSGAQRNSQGDSPTQRSKPGSRPRVQTPAPPRPRPPRSSGERSLPSEWTPGAGATSKGGLELDYGNEKAKRPERADELEFDPMAGIETTLGWTEREAGESPLELEFSSPRSSQSTPLPSRSSQPPSPQAPAAPASRPPVSRTSPPPVSQSQPPTSASAFAALELGISAPSLPEATSGHPVRGGQRQPGATGSRGPSGRADERHPSQRPPPRHAAPPVLSFGAMDMSGGPPGWDMEEMAAWETLHVAVPTRSVDEDGPWPTCRSPEPEDLLIDQQEVARLAGFGPKPRNALLAPMYFLRVSAGLRQLRDSLEAARVRLTDAERTRDERLARLAERHRKSLEDNDRFASLYQHFDRHAQLLEEQEKMLLASDATAAHTLASLESRLQQAKVEREQKQLVVQQAQQVRGQGELNIARQRAALKRLQIEERNILDKARRLAPPGADMPGELAARYSMLQEEQRVEESRLTQALDLQASLANNHSFVEDELRRSLADAQRLEGEKEGLMISHEGRMADQASVLEEMRASQLKDRARAGRAIVELHGEVPVERETRLSLLASDRAVLEASVELETVRRALGSFDRSAYQAGRTVLVIASMALVLAAVYAVVF